MYIDDISSKVELQQAGIGKNAVYIDIYFSSKY